MILRRPYAFLVKHFRIIHALLLMGALFLMLKTNSLVSFFGSYIKNGITMEEASSVGPKYASISFLLVSLLMTLLTGAIIYLLNYKKKKDRLYTFMLIFYIVLTILIIWMTSFLPDLAYTSQSIRFISIIRDLFRSTMVLNVIVMIMCFVRAFGFDVTKFDFKKDLLDLGVEQKDNEEYEFELKIDKDKIKAKIRKGLRYTKYFYKENKYIFTTLEIIVGCVIVLSLAKVVTGIEKVYKQNQYFEANSLKVKVLDSYKTKTNNFGNKLNSDYFYLITKIEINNNQSYDYTIDKNEIRLSYGDYELISPITSENSKFTEFGVNYFSQIIKPYESRIFNFIYEIPVEYYDENFTLKYLYDMYYEKNELKYKYKKVRLSPTTFNDKLDYVTTQTLGKELSFDGSILGNTKITINDISLNDNFSYNVIKCSNSSCINSKKTITAKTTEKFDLTLLRLNYKIDFDYDVLGKKYTNDEFISKFGSIRFEVKGKEYNNRLELDDVTPYYTNDYALIQVRDKLKLADKIYLDFVIRDKVFTYVIKDNTVKDDEKEGE